MFLFPQNGYEGIDLPRGIGCGERKIYILAKGYVFAKLEKCILELKNSLLRDMIFLYFLAEKWRCDMAVSYKKLFHLLIEKNMANSQLQQEAGFSANIITRLKRGGYISLESVESICRVLNCGVDDILEFIPEDNGGKENG